MNMKHGMLLLQVALISLSSLASVVGAGSAPTSMHLRFYMHDLATSYPGAPATVVRVTRGPTPLPTFPAFHFGDMFVMDDPLTEGPKYASGTMGRVQGFYLVVSPTEPTLLLCFNMVLTTGPHNGSTIAVLGRDATFEEARELPVVGGTGTLRGVTGYGLLRTHSINSTDNNVVLKIDMYLSLSV